MTTVLTYCLDFMGAGKNAENNRRLKDMNLPPAEYRNPPKSQCEIEDDLIWMGETERLAINLWFYHGRIVRFCVELTVFDDDEWVAVCRVDTCHSEVHRHVMTRDGQESRQPIVRLPGDDDARAWVILRTEYEHAHAELTARCEDYARRWRTS